MIGFMHVSVRQAGWKVGARILTLTLPERKVLQPQQEKNCDGSSL